MAVFTNIGNWIITPYSISFRGWYYSDSGTPAVRAEFYCNGVLFATEYAGGSGIVDWVTSNHEKTGLSPNTSYTLEVKFYIADGRMWGSASSVQTTSSPPPPPVPDTPSYAPLISSRGEANLTLYWGSSSGANGYVLAYKQSSSGFWNTVVVYGTSTTLYGLDYGESYDFKVYAFNSSGSSSYTGINSGTTLPQSPSIYIDSVTSNTVTVHVNALLGNYHSIRVYKYDSNNNLLGYQDIYWADEDVVFTGLTPNTTYKFDARTYLLAGSTGLWSFAYSTRPSATTVSRPPNWNWSYNIVSGGAVMETDVFPNKTIHAYIMSSSEWEAFTIRLNYFRNYKALPNYIFTIPNHEDDFEDYMLNEAISAINAMGYSIPLQVGLEVYADKFIQMRDTLNSII